MRVLYGFLCLVGIVGSRSAGAQTTVHEVVGQPGGGKMGWYVSSAGDHNQDGVGDYLATVIESATLAVEVRSGLDGALLGGVPANTPGPGVGVSPEGGVDLDADGVPDIVTGSAELGLGLVFSGATFGLLRQHAGLDSGDLFGQQAVVLGDVDLDGFPDYAFRAGSGINFPQPGKKRYVSVFSGAAGQHLHTTFGGSAGEYGCDIEPLDDITGDGAPEYLVSDPFADFGGGDGSGTSNEGTVLLLDGATGGLILQHWGSLSDHMGCDLVGLEDLDGDLLQDFATSRGPPGATTVMSIVNGAVLSEWHVPQGLGQFVLTGTDDLDADGSSDLLLGLFGVGGQATPRLIAIGSRTGSTVYQFDKPANEADLGFIYPWDVAAIGDVDGDGRKEWVLGNPGGGDPQAGGLGRVRVLSTRALYNHQPTIEASSGYRVDLDLNAGVPRAGNQYILLAGATGATPGVAVNNQILPLNFDFLTDVSILFANTSPFNSTLGSFDATGHATAWFDGSFLPPVAVGANLVFAYYSVGPGGVYVSTNPVVIPVQ